MYTIRAVLYPNQSTYTIFFKKGFSSPRTSIATSINLFVYTSCVAWCTHLYTIDKCNEWYSSIKYQYTILFNPCWYNHILPLPLYRIHTIGISPDRSPCIVSELAAAGQGTSHYVHEAAACLTSKVSEG